MTKRSRLGTPSVPQRNSIPAPAASSRRGPVAALVVVILIAYSTAGYFALPLFRPIEDAEPESAAAWAGSDEEFAPRPLPLVVDPAYPLPEGVDALVDEVRQVAARLQAVLGRGEGPPPGGVS